MIAHAGEHAGIGLETRQLADAGVHRVAKFGDQVAGDDREMRAQTVGGVDHAGQFALAQKRAQMNVAEVQQAQAIEAGGKSGNRHVDLAHTEIQPADQRAVRERREGRGQYQVGGGVERAPSAGIERRCPGELSQGLEHGPQDHKGGGWQTVGHAARAQHQGHGSGRRWVFPRREKRQQPTGGQEHIEEDHRAPHGDSRAAGAPSRGAQPEQRDRPLRRDKEEEYDEVQRLNQNPGPYLSLLL